MNIKLLANKKRVGSKELPRFKCFHNGNRPLHHKKSSVFDMSKIQIQKQITTY